jgi:hypothetical protein
MYIPSLYSQVNLFFSGSAVPRGAEMTFGVANPTNADPAVVAAAILTSWNTGNIKARQSTAIGLTQVLVKNGPNATGPFSYVTTSSFTGTVASASLTPNTAYLIRKNTALGGHKGAGRMFLPGLPENTVDEAGVITGLDLTATQTAVAAFLTALNTNGYPMQLLHADGVTAPNQVTSLAVQPRVATQRRRLRK